MTDVLGAVLAILVTWIVWLYFNPLRDHWRCGGTGKNLLRTKRTFGRCGSRRCQGGKVPRFGARMVWRVLRHREP